MKEKAAVSQLSTFLPLSLCLLFSSWLDIITPSSFSGKQNSDLYLHIGMVA